MNRVFLILGLFSSLSWGSVQAQIDDGSLVAWGWNDDGECTVPSPNAGFVAVAAGGKHSLGLKSDGTIVAWGANHGAYYGYGQCDVPWPNASFVAVAGGYYHSLGLKSDGTIVAWGDNDYGQCTVPSPNAGFMAVAAGGFHSLGLKSDGTIVAWGWNDDGQCTVPSPNTGFVAVAGGILYSLGLKSDGTIVPWGSNNSGQCTVPSPNASFAAIAGGFLHSLGLKSDGTIVAWGSNTFGQCSVPGPNAGFVAVAAGHYHSLGLKSDGAIVAWGHNRDGECNVPSPNAGFVAVAGGGAHSLAISGAPEPPQAFSLLSPNDEEHVIIDPSLTLLWRTARTANLTDSVSYTTYWSSDSTFVRSDSMTAHHDTTLTIDSGVLQVKQRYHWKVRAFNGTGRVTWSSPAEGWSLYVDGDTPAGPTVEAHSAEGGILLTWSVPADLQALGFKVYRRTQGSEWTCISPTLPVQGGATRYMDTHAQPGVLYEYEVEVIGPAGPAGRWGPVSLELGPVTLWFRVTPNPGRGNASLAFGLPRAGDVLLRVFDAAGREAAREAWTGLNAATYLRGWDALDGYGRPLQSGAYWLRLYTPSGVKTLRWTVVR